MSQKITEDQLKEWKAKYGDGNILALNIEGEKVYFVKPSKSGKFFHIAKRALIFQQQNDIIGAGEVVFNQCYLGGLGDKKEIDKENPVYLNCCIKCCDLIEILESNFTTV